MDRHDEGFPADDGLRELVAAVVEVPPSEGECSDFGPRVPLRIAEALLGSGVRTLYGHQKEAFDRVMNGENVVVATPAASGKSLCYTLPLLTGLCEDPGASALLLFPTKALSRDQEKSIAALLEASGIEAPVTTYDGDTPKEKRKTLRQQGTLVITNPDMLHAAILPRHTAWADLLATLRLIVVDEIHQYRGVFGSHVANVLRRLRRVLDFYGGRPTWVAASATIGNPRGIAEALTGLPFRLVDRAAAPSPGRKLYVFATPLVDDRTGVRQSYLRLSARIALDLMKQGHQTIVFANSRNAVEMLVRLMKERLKADGGDPEDVRGYRGGYIPADRRRVEDELKSGRLRCVVATSALELGIDVGPLDAVVLAGYPGTISGLWQRVGRVGRRATMGTAALVAGGSPLDQFIVRHPAYISGSNPESCHINPDNLDILVPHVRCAMSEIPFGAGEPFAGLEGDEMKEVLDVLVSGGEAALAGGRYHWVAAGAPARSISLRTAGSERFSILDEGTGRVIEEIERSRVLRSLHPRAIYQHSGAQFEVAAVDLDGLTVRVRETSCDYYTEPITEDRLTVIDEIDHVRAGGAELALGEIRITQRVVGFTCVSYPTNEILAAHETQLPEQEMEVWALWLGLRSSLLALSPDEGEAAVRETLGRKHPIGLMTDGLKGLGALMATLGSLRLMCDPRDLGASVTCDAAAAPGGDEATGRLYLYETYQGGVGLARGFYESFRDIARECLEVVTGCGCRAGCPSCVNPPEGRDDLRKIASTIILGKVT
jgi:DEAD/DEAH box helicase domain-containing protein